jgi:hypothetical protein
VSARKAGALARRLPAFLALGAKKPRAHGSGPRIRARGFRTPGARSAWGRGPYVKNQADMTGNLKERREVPDQAWGGKCFMPFAPCVSEARRYPIESFGAWSFRVLRSVTGTRNSASLPGFPMQLCGNGLGGRRAAGPSASEGALKTALPLF